MTIALHNRGTQYSTEEFGNLFNLSLYPPDMHHCSDIRSSSYAL